MRSGGIEALGLMSFQEPERDGTDVTPWLVVFVPSDESVDCFLSPGLWDSLASAGPSARRVGMFGMAGNIVQTRFPTYCKDRQQRS
jgi:hypothetical protein